MLSYQHIYHAGGPADLHKHSVLCAALTMLRGRHRNLTYMETHAGRGLYDLTSVEAQKTGEAAQGWLAPGAAAKVPPALAGIVRDLNGGADAPLYPGSPLIAARMLRAGDRVHLCELHPQEHAALAANFAGSDASEGGRVSLYKADGFQTIIDLSPPTPRRGLVLIDPSYEIKDEYESVVAFAARLRHRWPEASVLVWYPLLPAARHESMCAAFGKAHEDSMLHECVWANVSAQTGMYGSGMIALNLPETPAGFSRLAQ